MGSSPRSGVKILFCPSATMTLQIAIVILATALIASAAHISQDELEERLNKFHGFYVSQVEDISEAGAKTHNAVSSVTAELQSVLKMLVQEFGSMHATIAESRTENDALQKDLQKTKEAFEIQEKEKEHLLENVNELQGDVQNLKTQINVNEKTISSKNDEIVNMKTRNQQLQSDLEQKEAERRTCQEENETLQNEKRDLTKANAEQLETIESKDDKIDELQKENSKLEGTNKKLESNVQQITEEHKKCEDGNHALEESVQDLKRSNEEKTSTITTLNATIAESKAENGALQ